MTDVPQQPSDEEREAEPKPQAVAGPPPDASPDPESPSAAPTPASTAPVTDAAPFGEREPDDDADDDADEGEDEEPLEATRNSPYSVAAFAVSLLALFQAPQNIFGAAGQSLTIDQLLRLVMPSLLMPVSASVVALWLSFRGEEEIFVAGGRFGGVGLYRAARVISIVVLAIVVLALVMLLVFTEPPQPQFGQFG